MLRDILLAAACITCLPACTASPFALAPEAENVRVTTVAKDLAGCTPVGNILVPRDGDGFVAIGRAAGQFKNQAIGFGGNAAFITEGSPGIPMAGVAYRCPPAQTSGSDGSIPPQR